MLYLLRALLTSFTSVNIMSVNVLYLSRYFCPHLVVARKSLMDNFYIITCVHVQG